jgi:hypothetical protein
VALDDETAPEIQRCNLTTLIMTIKALGVKNVLSFDLMSVPTVEALSHGLESLYALGVLDGEAELTVLGKEMYVVVHDYGFTSCFIAVVHRVSLFFMTGFISPPIHESLVCSWPVWIWNLETIHLPW